MKPWVNGIACLAVILMLSSWSHSDVIHVPGDYPTIQQAIDAAAVSGDEIVVASGTYYEAINFNGKAVYLHSADGAEFTTIDASSFFEVSVVTCINGEGYSTILEGFTLTGGSGQTCPGGFGGGGMLNVGSSPTVRSCIFVDNRIQRDSWNGWGGGMCNIMSSPIVQSCRFINNQAVGYLWFNVGYGGGMYNGQNSSPIIENSLFIRNHVGAGYEASPAFGGGMFNDESSPNIRGCEFVENQGGWGGGGMHNWSNSSPFIVDTVFRRNSADFGGGVICEEGSNPTLVNCLFHANFTAQNTWGGGMWIWDGATQLINCTFTENRSYELNYAGAVGVAYAGRTVFLNCVFWGDVPDELSGPIGLVAYCDVQGGWDGPGNIDADPMFVDPVNEDFRVSAGSPCIDAGANPGVPFGTIFDMDRLPRFVDDPLTPDTGLGTAPIVDLGAYEFHDGSVSPKLSISPNPLQGGQQAEFLAAYFNPDDDTYLAFSLHGRGSTYVPVLNVTLDLNRPLQAGDRVVTDADGTAWWSLSVPAIGSGHNVWFQSCQFESKTNVVSTSIE